MKSTSLCQWTVAGVIILTPFVSFHYAVFDPPPAPIAAVAVPTEPEPEEVRRSYPMDPFPRVQVEFGDDQRFGIVLPRIRDRHNPDKRKRLTGDERGSTNNTVVRVDGTDYLFGDTGPGTRWVIQSTFVPSINTDLAWWSSWEIESPRVRVHQTVDIVMTG